MAVPVSYVARPAVVSVVYSATRERGLGADGDE